MVGLSPHYTYHSLIAQHVSVLAHEPLRVSLADLRSAGSKGKWWLVGAAWGGDPLVDRQLETQGKKIAPVVGVASDEVTDSALLKLARKQGMNTDIRRSIFVVLMSSDVSNLPYLPLVRRSAESAIRITLMHANDSHN